MPTPVAKDYITNKRYDKLMKHDQLKKQKKLRKVHVKSLTVIHFSVCLLKTNTGIQEGGRGLVDFIILLYCQS